MSDLFTFQVKLAATIRDDLLRSWRTGLLAIGVPNPNVSPGSDYYVLATGFANQLVVSQANAAIKADEILPDTAGWDGLIRWGVAIGLSPKAATVSSGTAELDASQSTGIPGGSQLLDGSGLKYKVSVGGTFADGASLAIESVDTGAATELAAGTTLRWVSAPPFASETVLVLAPGLKGGADAEDIEAFRKRVLAHLANPSNAGNWQHVAEMAESSSGSVEKCFPYPALQGPGTFAFAVTAAATATNRNRTVPQTTVDTVVVPTVQGLYPEHADIKGTTVINVATDVGFGLALPSASTASPPGPGGGWLDGQPWPTYAATGKCDVTVASSTTVFRLLADRAPTSGVSRVAFLSPTSWQLYTATVLSFNDLGGGLYEVTIDTPFVGLSVGSFVWPQALNGQAYVDAALSGFAAMGPGEKTASATILVRGYRHPVPSLAWPYALNAQQLRAVENVGAEVLAASYLYRSTTTPAVAATITSAPNQLVPRNLGFYPA